MLVPALFRRINVFVDDTEQSRNIGKPCWWLVPQIRTDVRTRVLFQVGDMLGGTCFYECLHPFDWKSAVKFPSIYPHCIGTQAGTYVLTI